jgi:hypothetical protein
MPNLPLISKMRALVAAIKLHLKSKTNEQRKEGRDSSFFLSFQFLVVLVFFGHALLGEEEETITNHSSSSRWMELKLHEGRKCFARALVAAIVKNERTNNGRDFSFFLSFKFLVVRSFLANLLCWAKKRNDSSCWMDDGTEN